MADSTSIKPRSGLTFTADIAGPSDGPLVLLLHGFPESRHSWRAPLPALADAWDRRVAADATELAGPAQHIVPARPREAGWRPEEAVAPPSRLSRAGNRPAAAGRLV